VIVRARVETSWGSYPTDGSSTLPARTINYPISYYGVSVVNLN